MRPGIQHLLCFSKNHTSGRSTPDLMMKKDGDMYYKNATPTSVCEFVISFLLNKKITSLFDPFCGKGSIGIACAQNGIYFTGRCDMNKEQCVNTFNRIKSIK